LPAGSISRIQLYLAGHVLQQERRPDVDALRKWRLGPPKMTTTVVQNQLQAFITLATQFSLLSSEYESYGGVVA
jgi:hypothetical protein